MGAIVKALDGLSTSHTRRLIRRRRRSKWPRGQPLPSKNNRFHASLEKAAPAECYQLTWFARLGDKGTHTRVLLAAIRKQMLHCFKLLKELPLRVRTIDPHVF